MVLGETKRLAPVPTLWGSGKGVKRAPEKSRWKMDDFHLFRYSSRCVVDIVNLAPNIDARPPSASFLGPQTAPNPRTTEEKGKNYSKTTGFWGGFVRGSPLS